MIDQELKIVKMKKSVDIFLRFGDFLSEVNERSFNWHTGEYEKGISVYPAKLENNVCVASDGWTSEICIYWDNIFSERNQYVLTGKTTGIGSDGEPLLVPSTIKIRGFYSPIGIQKGIPIDLSSVMKWHNIVSQHVPK